MTDEQAAMLIGVDIATYKQALQTIEQAGIASRTDCGMLYSRRLVREYERYLSASKAGKSGGGNPRLRKEESISQKPEAKGGLKPPLAQPIKVALNSFYSSDFLSFWNAYPNKKGKKAAWKSWTRAKDRPGIETILAEVQLQTRSEEWTKDGGAYIPHPATWINRGGWDDVVKPVGSTQTGWRR
jgi:hypothetical protein